MSSDKSNPDISEDIQTEPPISEISETSEAFKCDICGKIFPSEASLRGHLIRAHRTREPSYSRGEPTIEPAPKGAAKDPYVEALEQENARLKRELENALLQHRLSKYQPPPTSSQTLQAQDLLASDPLLRIKYAQLLDTIREQEEMRKQALKGNGDNSALTALQAQLESYKAELSEYHEKIEELKEELKRREIQSLAEKIEDLKRQIENARLATSDFAVLVREIKDLGEKWIKFSGGPLVELLMNSLGYVKVPSEKLITKETEEAEQSLLSLFEKRGWVVEG